RCPPDSNFSLPKTSSPTMRTTTSLKPPTSPALSLMISVRQPCRSAYRVYMRSRSPANSADSSPPVPARISRNVLRTSSGSLGSSSFCSSCSSRGRCPPSLARAPRGDAERSASDAARAPLTTLAQEEVLDRVAGTLARRRVAGMQLGHRAMQHLLREAARQRLHHRVHVVAARQQLARTCQFGG